MRKALLLLSIALAVAMCPPAKAATVTTDGDTYVRSGTADNFGTEGTINIKRSTAGATSMYTRTGWLHFDVSALPAEVNKASLTFTVSSCSSSNCTVTVWGIKDGQAGDNYGTDWSETAITGANAPVKPDFSENDNTTKLGEFKYTSSVAADSQIVFESQELADFLNADTNDSVTILFVRSQNDQELFLFARETSGKGAVLEASLLAYASDPQPADGAVDIEPTTSLTWQTGPIDSAALPGVTVTSHKLYISQPNTPIGDSSDPNSTVTPIVITDAGTGTTTYTPAAAFSRDATYYWRVDEVLSNGTTVEGFQWSFTTLPSTPVITVQPAYDQLLDAGEGFDLTIEATNPFTGDSTGLAYAWYHNDQLVTSGSANTFTVASATAADDGRYHCIVKILSNNATAQSNDAWVSIARCVQYHTFDDTLNDSAGTNHGTYRNTDPNALTPTFADGKDGRALSFNGQEYVTIGTAGQPGNATLRHGTVTCWVKTTSDGTIINNRNGASNQYTTCLQYHIKSGKVRTYLRFADATSTERNTGVVNDDQWHMVTTTWQADEAGSSLTIYVDGVSTGTTTSTQTFTAFDPWQYDVVIGGSTAAGEVTGGFFNGLIDDMQVYNYPMTADEVATIYYGFTGQSVCLYPPSMDFTGDCKVDLKDLQKVVQAWLECGLYPACAE